MELFDWFQLTYSIILFSFSFQVLFYPNNFRFSLFLRYFTLVRSLFCYFYYSLAHRTNRSTRSICVFNIFLWFQVIDLDKQGFTCNPSGDDLFYFSTCWNYSICINTNFIATSLWFNYVEFALLKPFLFFLFSLYAQTLSTPLFLITTQHT